MQYDIVIYHANCLDGFAAAWAAHKHSPAAEFVPASYGDAPPDVTDKRVLIVDFSYPRDVLLAMHEQAESLLVLDHHKTAAEDLAGLDFAVFDMERSGAGITWDELRPDNEIFRGVWKGDRPDLIMCVEDRDLWRFKFPITKAYVAALSVLPFDFAAWDTFAQRSSFDIACEGQAILTFTQRTVEKIAKRGYAATLTSLTYDYFDEPERTPVLAVNCPPEFVSDTADYLKPRANGRAIVGWFFDGERGDFVFSLRSAEDGPDVSEIARAFGGGGHKHAAGFRWERNPLVKS